MGNTTLRRLIIGALSRLTQNLGQPDIECAPDRLYVRELWRLDRFDRHCECFRPYPTRNRGEIFISKSQTDRPSEISVSSRPGQSDGPTDYILCPRQHNIDIFQPNPSSRRLFHVENCIYTSLAAIFTTSTWFSNAVARVLPTDISSNDRVQMVISPNEHTYWSI